MKRRSLLKILLLAPFMLGGRASRAQESEPVIRAVNAITAAFLRFLEVFRDVGRVAERDYLVRGLGRMNRQLFALEQTKLRLAAELSVAAMSPARLASIIDEVPSRIQALQSSWLDLAPRLRVIAPGEMDRVIALLGDAIAGQLTGLGPQLPTPETRSRDLRQARRTVAAVRRCQEVVARVIGRLRPRA